MQILALVLDEMADRLYPVGLAPATLTAEHRPAPGVGEGVEILIAGGGLHFAGKLELVGHVGLFQSTFRSASTTGTSVPQSP